ncbi:MAG: DUF3726 domain-containing protein, partial [Pseudomonadota bacterium]
MSYRLTLAEVESYLRKSAQAVGLDWGIAEEAGKAARWLAAFDLEGPEYTLNHLLELRDQDYRRFIPDVKKSPWQASGDLLCPIITGAAIADRSAGLLQGEKFELADVAYPLLLAATIGQAARCHRAVFTTAWADVRVSCFENGISIEGNRESLSMVRTESVSCYLDNLSEPQVLPSTLSYGIDENTFQRLDELAFQTYAPATEASRAGAGAG